MLQTLCRTLTRVCNYFKKSFSNFLQIVVNLMSSLKILKVFITGLLQYKIWAQIFQVLFCLTYHMIRTLANFFCFNPQISYDRFSMNHKKPSSVFNTLAIDLHTSHYFLIVSVSKLDMQATLLHLYLWKCNHLWMR